MSIHWIDRVWKLSAQKGSILLTELAIADNANDAGVAWPGLETLAFKTRLSERNVNRMTAKLDESRELAIHHGGMGRRNTNIYVMLIGRDPEEIDAILKMLKQKHVNLSTLKGGQFVMVDKLSMTKKHKKVDTAMSTEPLRTNDQYMNGWMDTDPICIFLKTLPGFNTSVIESTRREILSNHYDVSELPYLWNECAFADNPIGMFTHKVTTGQHSVDWQMLKMQQAEETERKALNDRQHNQIDAELARRAERDPAGAAPDPAGAAPDPYAPNEEQLQTWHAIISELSFDAKPNTYKAYIEPARVISVNGNWTIATPAPEWWRNNMSTSVKRIYKKLTGEVTEFVFVEQGR